MFIRKKSELAKTIDNIYDTIGKIHININEIKNVADLAKNQDKETKLVYESFINKKLMVGLFNNINRLKKYLFVNKPMEVMYIGESFGPDCLTDKKIYTVIDTFYNYLNVIDDSGNEILYSASNPAPLDGSSPGGKWKIIKDDKDRTLKRYIE